MEVHFTAEELQFLRKALAYYASRNIYHGPPASAITYNNGPEGLISKEFITSSAY